jgi:hypothetical protein
VSPLNPLSVAPSLRADFAVALVRVLGARPPDSVVDVHARVITKVRARLQHGRAAGQPERRSEAGGWAALTM